MITEHDMLVTLATMAIKMDDLTGHDVVEALRAHGYGDVVAEARKENLSLNEIAKRAWEKRKTDLIVAELEDLAHRIRSEELFR